MPRIPAGPWPHPHLPSWARLARASARLARTGLRTSSRTRSRTPWNQSAPSTPFLAGHAAEPFFSIRSDARSIMQSPGCAKKDPNGAPWLPRLRNNRNERLTSLPVVAAPIETPHPPCASLCYARIRKTLRVSVRHIGASIDTFFSAFPVSQSDFCRRFCDFRFSPPGKAMDHRRCAGHDG
jgi:hypothetical protein